MRKLLLFLIILSTTSSLFAQKKDTSVYYVTNNGKIVSTKDSADYFLLVLPPDISVDKKLNIIKEYYKDGKIKLIGNATKDIKFQGTVISFFPNGHKMELKNYDNGIPVGDLIEYYPNGKLYNVKTYKKTTTEETELLLENCQDSTGNVLAENGNGSWLKYNKDFTRITETGKIKNGYQDSIWKELPDNKMPYYRTYKNGKIISYDNDTTFSKVDIVPQFQGGIEMFFRYLGLSMRYPHLALENNVQGRVVVTFIVEKDGALSDIKIIKGIGSGCDEEALRVIKLSPPWQPGMQNGKPVRCRYTVPIAFTINK